MIDLRNVESFYILNDIEDKIVFVFPPNAYCPVMSMSFSWGNKENEDMKHYYEWADDKFVTSLEDFEF